MISFITFLFSDFINFMSDIKKAWNNNDQVLVGEKNGIKIYARFELPSEQRLSDYILENAVYPDRTEEWMSLLPNCHKVSLTAKSKNNHTVGFHQVMKFDSSESFQSIAQSQFNWEKIENKKWFKRLSVEAV